MEQKDFKIIFEKLIKNLPLEKEEIKEIILHDTKQDVMEREVCNKVFNSAIFKCKTKYMKIPNQNVEKYVKEKLYYNNKDTHLKNFLKYKTLLTLYLAFDCDTSKYASEIIQKVYDVKEEKKGRIYNKDNYIFESDTMNSLTTILLYYIRTILNECKNEEDKKIQTRYIKEYKLEDLERRLEGNTNKNKILRFYLFFYLLEKIDDIKEEFIQKNDIHQKIFEQLEILARLTHSIGNFGLVPYKFNFYRGNSYTYNDYWFKSYKDSIEKDPEELAFEICTTDEKEKVLESIIGYREKLNRDLDEPINNELKFPESNSGKSNDMSTYINILNILVYININILNRGINICNNLTNIYINPIKIDFFQTEDVDNYIKKIRDFFLDVTRNEKEEEYFKIRYRLSTAKSINEQIEIIEETFNKQYKFKEKIKQIYIGIFQDLFILYKNGDLYKNDKIYATNVVAIWENSYLCYIVFNNNSIECISSNENYIYKRKYDKIIFNDYYIAFLKNKILTVINISMYDEPDVNYYNSFYNVDDISFSIDDEHIDLIVGKNKITYCIRCFAETIKKKGNN